MKSFEELKLSEEVMKALKTMEYEIMTEIQEKAIPKIMEGKDITGQSKTGTGKTATFGIPAVETADTTNKNVQVLILCPTRELALQNAEVIKKIARFKKGLLVNAVYGGDSIERQIRDLKKGSQIVIGTPGRIMDHMRRHSIKFNDIKIVVLDEADEMLNMGFEEDIQTILKEIENEHQTILFSATMPKRILDITKKYQKTPELIKVVSGELTVSNIDQGYFDTKEKMKAELLKRVLKVSKPKSAVVFCNTKKKVEELMEELKGGEIVAEALHGDIRQTGREKTMKKFKSGKVNLLIATDVAARGIDVDNLDIVFNYDLPQEEEYYVHRIGRTGRNGKEGKAISFVVGKQIRKLKDIERYAQTKIKCLKAPTLNEVDEIENKEFIDKVRNIISEKNYSEDKVLKKLSEEYSYEEISNALYSMMTKKTEKPEKYKMSDSGLVKLFVNRGKLDKVAVKDIIGSITANTAISGKDIGKIILLDKYSFIEIPAEFVEEVINGMKNKKIKGKDVKFEVSEKE